MNFESIPLTNTLSAEISRTSSQSLRTVTFQDLPAPSTTAQRVRQIWPYRKQLSMRYARLPEDDDGADIVDMGSSHYSESGSMNSRHEHAGSRHENRHDGECSTDHHHHTPHGRVSEESGCLSSASRTTRSLVNTLGSYAKYGHTGLSSFTRRHLPPPEDPCAPSACCCWAAVHDLCFSPSDESNDEADHDHDNHHEDGSHSHHGGLQIKKVLDPHDQASCSSHCCDESRYFLSTKAKPPTGCHGH